MCVAYPAQVTEIISPDEALVNARGKTQSAALFALDNPSVSPGDWLLVQSGIALVILDEADAARRIALIEAETGS
jgi:hydrogenase assembly chaperone HypC/HupF